jgi:hypothetical protein
MESDAKIRDQPEAGNKKKLSGSFNMLAVGKSQGKNLYHPLLSTTILVDFQCIQGAFDTLPRLAQHMCVNHGGGNVRMAQKALDGTNIGAGLQQVGGKGVPKRVRGDALGDT